MVVVAAQRPKLVTEDWQKVLDLQKAGDVVDGTIKAVNRSEEECAFNTSSIVFMGGRWHDRVGQRLPVLSWCLLFCAA